MMSRLSEIYEGWKNYIFPNPEVEALAKERMAICVECEFLNALNVCTRCLCPKAGKARSPESRCLENKWPDGWGKQPEPVLPVSEQGHTPGSPPVLYVDENNREYYFENMEFFEQWQREGHQTGGL